MDPTIPTCEHKETAFGRRTKPANRRSSLPTNTRVLGEKVIYHHIPREVFAEFDFPGAGDLANTFEFNRLYIPNRQADLAECRKLYPAMQRFEAWLRPNNAKF